MRLMQSDLAILNAEQYDVGVHFPGMRSKKASSSTRAEAGPRKKMKTSVAISESMEHEEEEKKRSRGRPRLDTKDETAAERRRTQIRLAQRAYRNRKENAISTLEKRVQDLRETNEEMSNAFMKLHDFAVSNGLLEQAPEFGRQLRSTTEIFLALAKRSADDSEKDHSHSGSPEQDVEESSIDALSKRVHQDVVATSQPTTKQQVDAPGQLYGGFTVSHEPPTQSDMIDSILPTTYSSQPDVISAPLGYEIVTVPTLENASFPFGLNPDSPFGNIFSHNPAQYSPSQTPLLPLPDTYSYQEATFGRRLQRVALEKGLQLITMPDPPKELFAKVFGFCILFEPLEKIKERLRAGIKKSKEESMHYWQFPFLQLGGAGSHVPGFSSTTTPPNLFESSDDGHRIGSNGTIERFKHPNASSGFGIGPFTEAVTEARDQRVGARMRINLPGFQGDFYDSDEVELYLQERGVTIGAAQDFVTVEVDMALFDDDADGQSLVLSNSPTPSPPVSGVFGTGITGMSAFSGMNGLDATNPFATQNLHNAGSVASTCLSPHQSPGSSSDDTTVLTMPDASVSSDWPSNMLLPTTSAPGMDDPLANMFTTTTAGAFGDNNLFAFAGLETNHGTKRIVTLDVNLFIQGFRPKDVNAAFWIATRNG